MIKLKTLIFESNDNWNRWIQSMVETVKDSLMEREEYHTDIGEAYDILKSNFRADAPSHEMFDRASKEAIEILKKGGTIR